MSKLMIVLVIASSVATFRRAGEGFTSVGKAFTEDYFSDEQLTALRKEKKLSIREVPIDAIPEGVDTTVVDSALEKAAKAAEAEAAKAPAKFTPAKKPAAKKPTAAKADANTPKATDAAKT